MLSKRLGELTAADLQQLIGVSERRTLEFKRDLVGPREEDKREFLADASSLAPHVVGSRAPRLARLTRRAAPLPALAAIAARAIIATARPLAPGVRRRTAVATIAAVSIVEALGAIAERTVHRRLSSP